MSALLTIAAVTGAFAVWGVLNLAGMWIVDCVAKWNQRRNAL